MRWKARRTRNTTWEPARRARLSAGHAVQLCMLGLHDLSCPPRQWGAPTPEPAVAVLGLRAPFAPDPGLSAAAAGLITPTAGVSSAPSGLSTVAVMGRRVRSSWRPTARPRPPASSASRATVSPRSLRMVYLLHCRHAETQGSGGEPPTGELGAPCGTAGCWQHCQTQTGSSTSKQQHWRQGRRGLHPPAQSRG